MAAAFISGYALPSFAEDLVNVSPEVVTGSRLYTNLDELPAPAYVVTRKDIEKSGASTLSKILSRVPGVSTRSRSGNTQGEFIEIRGLTTELLFLIDGVPYYKTSHVAGAASVDLRSLPLMDIERIEIVKGAGSAVYGSMAAAGVINIITRKPQSEEYKISVTGGTYDRKEGSFRASMPGKKVNVSAWFTHQEEGESPLLYYYSDYTGEIMNNNEDYENDSGGIDLSSGPFSFSASWGEYTSKWTYGTDLEKQNNDFARYSLVYQEDSQRFLLYSDRQDKDVFQYGNWTSVKDKAWGAEYSRKVFLKDAIMSLGMAYREEDMEYRLPAYLINYDKSRENYAPFLEVSLPLRDVVMDLGLRYENWHQDQAQDYDELIPKLSFSYQTAKGTLWYLSAGRFFAMPSLYELSYFGYPATKANSALKPEDGWSFESGFKKKCSNGTWNMGIFSIEMDNKIAILPDYSQYENISEFRSWGVESIRSWDLSDNWGITIGATWMEAEQRDDGSSQWTKAGTPEWDLDAAFSYEKGPFYGELSVSYLGNREDERAGIGQLSQGDVTTVDAILTYATEAGTFRFEGYNIFDKEYYLQDYSSWGTTTRYYGPEARYYLTWEFDL